MNIPHWYERLVTHVRSQPQEVKSHTAFVGALIVTVAIAAVWATTLPARFSLISQVGEGVGDISTVVTDHTAALSDALPTPIPETPTVDTPAVTTAEERIRARVDALLNQTADEKNIRASTTAPTVQGPAPEEELPLSRPGMPVLIEAR